MLQEDLQDGEALFPLKEWLLFNGALPLIYFSLSLQILYFVYKNIALGLTLFYYELYTAFSGEVLYDDWYMVLFNVMLTSLPVISLGVLEQDVSSEVCLQVKRRHTLHYILGS